MRTTEQERRDLVVLVADSQQKHTVATLLTRRQPSLGIRQVTIDIDSDIFPHPERDPGVFKKAGRFLSVFAQRYQHALVLIDAEWGGLSVEQIEEKIQDDLNKNGWEGRSAVIVIDPELEIWVWAQSPHVPSTLSCKLCFCVRIKSFEFLSCVIESKLPVDTHLFSIACFDPSVDLSL